VSSFIFTWNPDEWDWWASDLQHCLDETAAKRTVPGNWSTGSRTRGISSGDRVFLLRQGSSNRGIIAAGTLHDGIFQEAHWDGSGKLGNYADLDWELVIDPAHPLPLADLDSAMPNQHWTPRGSGTLLMPEYELTIEQLWADHIARLGY